MLCVLFGQNLVCRDFRYTSRLIYPGNNLKFIAWRMYHHTHTYTNNHLHVHTQ